jgi:hypothetical protein
MKLFEVGTLVVILIVVATLVVKHVVVDEIIDHRKGRLSQTHGLMIQETMASKDSRRLQNR